MVVIAIKTDGKLWAWGNNNNGQLGLGHISPNMYSSPVQVGSDEDWSAVTGGSPTNSSSSAHSLAIKTSGKLYSWGYGPQGQLGQGTTVTGTESPLQVESATSWY